MCSSFNANAMCTECTLYLSNRDKNSIAASNWPVIANTLKMKNYEIYINFKLIIKIKITWK